MGIFDKGVKKTNLNFFQKLGRAIVGKSKVDDDVLDALEEALLSSRPCCPRTWAWTPPSR